MRRTSLILVLVHGLGLLLGAWPSRAAPDGDLFLPTMLGGSGQPPPSGCRDAPNNPYTSGTAFQHELDDPVRPADEHADKNLEMRGYVLNQDPDLQRELVNYGSDDPTQPPQLATLFQPARVPLSAFYQVREWQWAPSPDPGQRGEPKADPPVTALGLATTTGETLHVPTSGYDIGGGMEVLIIFADEDTIALHYTREDTAGLGYTVHVDNICTDPALLSLYNSLDAANGPRYDYVPPSQRPYSYPLPNLPAGAVIGTARGNRIVVAIVDSGSHMDPRSCNEWWQIRPGYTGSCPPPVW